MKSRIWLVEIVITFAIAYVLGFALNASVGAGATTIYDELASVSLFPMIYVVILGLLTMDKFGRVLLVMGAIPVLIIIFSFAGYYNQFVSETATDEKNATAAFIALVFYVICAIIVSKVQADKLVRIKKSEE